MRTLNHTLYYPGRGTLFTFWDLTDIHLGHAACDEPMFRADIAAIAADPFAYWIGGGDYVDAIPRKGDRRYSETSIARWLWGENDPVGLQIERMVDLLRPIAPKCLGLRSGNHEGLILDAYDRDVYREIVKGVATAAGREMRDLALSIEGFVRVRFRRGTPDSFGGVTTLTIYLHHGAGGGRKRGADALRMEETLLQYDADLVFLGHRHKAMAFPLQVVCAAGRGVRMRDRLGVWGGSYLHPYLPDDRDIPADNYPQRKHLPPVRAGMVPVLVKPDVLGLTPVLAAGGATAAEMLAALRGGPEPPGGEPRTLPLHLVRAGERAA